MSDKYSHVRLFYRKDTNHYYAEIKSSEEEETFLLDLGEDEENMNKVIKILREEYGGIPFYPGQIN